MRLQDHVDDWAVPSACGRLDGGGIKEDEITCICRVEWGILLRLMAYQSPILQGFGHDSHL